MTSLAYRGPSTERATDWRDKAACRTADPAVFFPIGTTGPAVQQAEKAKAVCRGCPVVTECLDWALNSGEENGIWGGLTEDARRSLQRAAHRRDLTPEEAAARAAAARQPGRPRTLQTIYDDHTVPLPGGHLGWNGGQKVSYRGRNYTSKQLAFTLARGHAPTGAVTADCGISACVLGAHMADQTERAVCGTRGGYQRHLRNAETACARCRQANTDADNRLRRTGTTLTAAGAR